MRVKRTGRDLRARHIEAAGGKAGGLSTHLVTGPQGRRAASGFAKSHM
jgi:hypothetical protein